MILANRMTRCGIRQSCMDKDLVCCHAERSEVSGDPRQRQILRFAQDDNPRSAGGAGLRTGLWISVKSAAIGSQASPLNSKCGPSLVPVGRLLVHAGDAEKFWLAERRA